MKLRTKLGILLLLFSSVFMGYVHMLWMPQLKQEVIRLSEDEYRSHLNTTAEALIHLLLENQLANVHETLNALKEDNPHWLMLTLHSTRGDLLYPIEAPVQAFDPDTTLTLRKDIGFMEPFLAELTLVADMRPAHEASEALEQTLGIALLVLLFGFIVSVAFTMEVVIRRPLDILINASQQLVLGNYSSPLPLKNSDEIGELTHSFSQMRKALKHYHINLSGEIDKHRRTTDALKKAKASADHQASHDALTNLINRREFERVLSDAHEDAGLYAVTHTLCYMDLDQFKIVNDTCGHQAGDELLRQISDMLQRMIRSDDTLARLGGDEFGLLLNCCSQDDARIITEKICSAVSNFRFSWQDKIFVIGVSIGAIQIDQDSPDIEQLMSHADSACYAAKENGRNQVHFYSESDAIVMDRQNEMLWAGRLTNAIDKQHLQLYIQPICNLESSSTTHHYEVLLRLIDGNKLIVPGAFIPAAERYGLITMLDRWVFTQVIEFLQQREKSSDSLQININISGISLGNSEFLEHIETTLKKKPHIANQICFEVTESAAVRNMVQASSFILKLKKLGCQFALDDFGSGMCSFGYLKELPVDYLKIDGNLVRNIHISEQDRIIVESIHRIAGSMNMTTIAEYVENSEVSNILRDIGIPLGQGFYLGSPRTIHLLDTKPDPLNSEQV